MATYSLTPEVVSFLPSRYTPILSQHFPQNNPPLQVTLFPQKWYDGYMLNGLHIYNPKSVAGAVWREKFKSYWTGTETYEALKAYIELNFNGLNETVIEMPGNARCKIDPSACQNDMTTFKTKDNVLTLLVHLGYLAFDESTEEVFIPNPEIMQEFLRAVKAGGWDGLIQTLDCSSSFMQTRDMPA